MENQLGYRLGCEVSELIRAVDRGWVVIGPLDHGEIRRFRSNWALFVTENDWPGILEDGPIMTDGMLSVMLAGERAAGWSWPFLLVVDY